MPTKNYCLNCESPIQESDKYCPNCGQLIKNGIPTVRELLQDSIASIFNIDNRIFHTLRDLYRPSKLTKYYIAGKRKYYLQPIRIYILSLLLLVSVLLSMNPVHDWNFGSENAYSLDQENELKRKYAFVIDSLGEQVDTSIVKLFNKELFNDNLNIKSDTLGKTENNFFNLQSDVYSYKIPMHDALYLSNDSLNRKYDITGFDKIRVRQYIRWHSDTAGFVKDAVKNGVWVVLLTIILVSLILKLIYFRGKYYYIEHFVNQLYLHSYTFVGILFMILLYQIQELCFGDSFDIVSYLWIVYLVIIFQNFKQYYSQGYFKTIIKFMIYLFSYVLIVTFCFAFVAYISFFIV